MRKMKSQYSCLETASHLERFLTDKGIKIFTHIDHAQAAHDAGLDLPYTKVVIFGDPKVGTLLMKTDPCIAIDLPLKILIWEEQGVCHAGYKPLADNVKSSGLHMQHQMQTMDKIDGLLDSILTHICGAS